MTEIYILEGKKGSGAAVQDLPLQSHRWTSHKYNSIRLVHLIQFLNPNLHLTRIHKGKKLCQINPYSSDLCCLQNEVKKKREKKRSITFISQYLICHSMQQQLLEPLNKSQSALHYPARETRLPHPNSPEGAVLYHSWSWGERKACKEMGRHLQGKVKGGVHAAALWVEALVSLCPKE